MVVSRVLQVRGPYGYVEITKRNNRNVLRIEVQHPRRTAPLYLVAEGEPEDFRDEDKWFIGALAARLVTRPSVAYVGYVYAHFAVCHLMYGGASNCYDHWYYHRYCNVEHPKYGTMEVAVSEPLYKVGFEDPELDKLVAIARRLCGF